MVKRGGFFFLSLSFRQIMNVACDKLIGLHRHFSLKWDHSQLFPSYVISIVPVFHKKDTFTSKIGQYFYL